MTTPPVPPRGFYECAGSKDCLHNAGYDGGVCPIHQDLQRIAFARATRRPSRYALDGVT